MDGKLIVIIVSIIVIICLIAIIYFTYKKRASPSRTFSIGEEDDDRVERCQTAYITIRNLLKDLRDVNLNLGQPIVQNFTPRFKALRRNPVEYMEDHFKLLFDIYDKENIEETAGLASTSMILLSLVSDAIYTMSLIKSMGDPKPEVQNIFNSILSAVQQLNLRHSQDWTELNPVSETLGQLANVKLPELA